jgi:hypothetical protein
MSEAAPAREVNLRRQAEAMAAIDEKRRLTGTPWPKLGEMGGPSRAAFIQWANRQRDPSLYKLLPLAEAFGFSIVMCGNGHCIDLGNLPDAIHAIDEQRKKRGWNLCEAADRSGISIWSFRAWRALRRSPGLSNFVALAETFGFTVIMRQRTEALAVSEGP